MRPGGLLALALCAGGVQVGVNPARKVITLLENLRDETQKEGKETKELFDAYMCKCQKQLADLEAQMTADTAAEGEKGPLAKRLAAEVSALDAEVAQHDKDRRDARASLQESTATRAKAHATFVDKNAEFSSNMKAIQAALKTLQDPATEFLQTKASTDLRQVLVSHAEKLNGADVSLLTGFLQSQGRDGSSGEVVGILKQMLEEMRKDQQMAADAEKKEAKEAADLDATLQKQVTANQDAKEEKVSRVGELRVELVQAQNDLKTTRASLANSGSLLTDVKSQCKEAEVTYEEGQKSRALELDAIAQTLQVLGDDDTLEIVKKTVDRSRAALLESEPRQSSAPKLVSFLQTSQREKKPARNGVVKLALAGVPKGLDAVAQQVSSFRDVQKHRKAIHTKEFKQCKADLGAAQEEVKATTKVRESMQAALEATESELSAVLADIQAKQKEIKELDEDTKAQTEERRADHAEQEKVQSENAQAIDLLRKAANRLQKFFAPQMHEAEAAPAPTQGLAFVQDEADDAPSFVQTGAEETKDFKRDTSAHRESATGIFALMETLVRDLQSAIAASKKEEEIAQDKYDSTMQASKATRDTARRAVLAWSTEKARLEERKLRADNEFKNAQSAVDNADQKLRLVQQACSDKIANYEKDQSAFQQELDNLASAAAALRGMRP